MFRSADGGQTWQQIRLSPRLASSGVDRLAVNPESPGVIYAAGINAGVLLSEDGGTSWRRVTTGLPSLDVEALAMHAFRRKTLFVSVRGKGVYRTEDGGGQWERMDGGPPGKSVLALAHSPLEGSMNTGWLYAGTVDGPYLSMDCF
ncbi:MAG: WD40/YVTN/BNR-like repeat-containing protein [bacterium]